MFPNTFWNKSDLFFGENFPKKCGQNLINFVRILTQNHFSYNHLTNMILALSVGIAAVTLAILYTMFEIQINITSLEKMDNILSKRLKAFTHEKEKA